MEPAFRQADLMAKLTGDPEIAKYTKELINFGIRGQVTKPEDFFEKGARYIGGKIEKATSRLPEKYQFHTKDRATRQILNAYRRATYAGAMSYNPAPALRNATQQLLNIPLTNTQSWLWGQRSLFTEGGKELASHCRLTIGRMPLEALDPTTLSKLEMQGSKMFRLIDQYPNVMGGYNANIIYLAKKNPDVIKIARRFGDFSTPNDVNRFSKAVAKAFDAGELKWLDELATTKTKIAQYGYHSYDMPKITWRGGPVTKAATQFMSWMMNYYYSYLPELIKMLFSGVGPGGIALGKWERMAFLRHLLNMEALALAGQSMGVDMSRHRAPRPSAEFPFVHGGGAAPVGLSPAWYFGKGLVQMVFGGLSHDSRMVGEGKYSFRRGITFAPPVVIKKIGQTPEKGLGSIFFKMKEEEPSSYGSRTRPTRKR